MTKTMTAAAALVLGVALTAGAHAHGVARHSMNQQQRTMQSGSTMPPQAMQQRHLSKNQVKQLQRKLRADGLYRGRIDGIDGRKTRQALAKFQQQQGATGFGSSMPNGARRNPTLNNNQNQSFNNNGATLPQTNESTAGSGSSMPPQNQNTNLQNQNPNQQNQYNQKQQ